MMKNQETCFTLALRKIRWFGLLATLALFGCHGLSDKTSQIGEEIGDKATEAVHDMACKLVESSIPGGEGHGFPGDAGYPRFGLQHDTSGPLRVRRSWSTLDASEKQEVTDAFLALKLTRVDSSEPGAERAAYTSYCGNYDRNLYDFYVELHASAFVSMHTTDMGHTQMPHMGPQFLAWHRYLLMRVEADLRQASGNADFTLPYWDWEDCQADTEDGENPCPPVFEPQFLGSPGSCDDDDQDVSGFLLDGGFERHLWMEAGLNGFSVDGIHCETGPLERAVGCSDLAEKPANAADIEAIYSRTVYDVEPYNSCSTDEDVSFRQYLEGFTDTDTVPICVAGGCQMHGQGHIYIGGDMGSGGSINDPIFFLHHANVDRIWTLWQDRNRSNPDTAVDYGNPGFPDDWRGSIYNFDEVRADELFDFRSLGYRYDTNEQ